MGDHIENRHLGWIAAWAVPSVLGGTALIAYWLEASKTSSRLPLWPVIPFGLITLAALYMIFAPIVPLPPFRRDNGNMAKRGKGGKKGGGGGRHTPPRSSDKTGSVDADTITQGDSGTIIGQQNNFQNLDGLRIIDCTAIDCFYGFDLPSDGDIHVQNSRAIGSRGAGFRIRKPEDGESLTT